MNACMLKLLVFAFHADSMLNASHHLPQVRIYESINFKEFVKLLSAFSPRAGRDLKLATMFMVYDVDGDGEREVEGK